MTVLDVGVHRDDVFIVQEFVGVWVDKCGAPARGDRLADDSRSPALAVETLPLPFGLLESERRWFW